MLRPYQQEAVTRMLADLPLPGNSVLCLGTAAGKSHIISAFVEATQQPTLILCPNREILIQNKTKLLPLVSKSDIGVYSASMSEKNIKKYTFATIGSIFRKPELFEHFDTVLVDECHVVRPDEPKSMYMKLFRSMQPKKVFGFTATPYLNVTKNRYGWTEDGRRYVESTTYLQIITRMENKFWNKFIYNYDAKKLETNGFTVPCVYHPMNLINPEKIRTVSNGREYDQDDFARKVYDYKDKILEVCRMSMEDHKSTLVFCATIAQANSLSEEISNSKVVTSETPPKERTKIIEEFKSGILPILFNVSCLTTGFDAPNITSIICLRPTKSLGLYQQFIGRGVRLCPDKDCCDVYDLSGTYTRLGKAVDICLANNNNEVDLISGSGEYWHNKKVASIRIPTTH